MLIMSKSKNIKIAPQNKLVEFQGKEVRRALGIKFKVLDRVLIESVIVINNYL